MFDILSVFSESDYAVTVFMTGKKGDAEEMARNESGKFDVVVCVGGDGTLSEVMSGPDAGRRPRRSRIYPQWAPANDVAATLAFPKSARRRPGHRRSV